MPLDDIRPREPRDLVERGGAVAVASPRVLIIEDNLDLSRFITDWLSASYHAVSAVDCADGLAKAIAFQPALIVTELVMPGGGGEQLIAGLRARPELAETPVLLLASKADEELMIKLLDNGAADFVIKPLSQRELAVRVRNLVHGRLARLEAVQSLAREHAARLDADLQKQLLHSLFMQAPTLIAVLRGPDHIVELANPQICKIWEQTEPQIIGRPLFDILPPLRTNGTGDLFDGVYRTGVTFFGKEMPAWSNPRRQPGDRRYFNAVYSAFRNATGEVEGIFIVAADVTEQVRARAEVDALRAAAESANRAKDEFLAILGHELRNPLSPIVTALQLIKLRGPEALDRARTVIERQVNHLIRLVDDLLDVSRIARGVVELKMEPVELAEVVAKAIEMASPLLEQRGHTLTVEVARTGLVVDGDAMRLAQVVSNLLTNAAKYTPPGGYITVRGERTGGEVILRVRDTGIGMAAEFLPRIFDLFVQERQPIDRSQGGLGLGLTIVRSLIERHGGSVLAHSDGPGRGSELVIRLPAVASPCDADAASSPGAPELAAPRPSPARVLVVDDNEDAAVLLVEALAQRGYEARVAHDAPSALRVAAEFTPNIAFLDIGLPVMDGYELAAHLRGMPGLAGLRLIAVTGYGQESDRQRTRRAGFHDHLVKPVVMETIEAAIQNAGA